MLTQTTTAMLDALLDPANEAVWEQFDRRYRPILVALGRQVGLSHEDAADAAQEALARFVKSYRAGHYERGRGRLSAWLIGIARHCIADQQRERVRRRAIQGTSAVMEIPDEQRLTEIWSAERERAILAQALQEVMGGSRLEERTVRAFELLVLRQLAPAEVASLLSMTMNDVYLAKHRCLKKMRTAVTELTRMYEDDQ